MIQIKTPREYVETVLPEVEWNRTSKEDTFLYSGVGNRCRIQYEQMGLNIDHTYQRSALYATVGIDDNEVDAIALAKDIVEYLMPNFSPYEMTVIVAAMQKELAIWDAEYTRLSAIYVDTHGKTF